MTIHFFLFRAITLSLGHWVNRRALTLVPCLGQSACLVQLSTRRIGDTLVRRQYNFIATLLPLAKDGCVFMVKTPGGLDLKLSTIREVGETLDGLISIVGQAIGTA